jgi:hypothetical protein
MDDADPCSNGLPQIVIIGSRSTVQSERGLRGKLDLRDPVPMSPISPSARTAD